MIADLDKLDRDTTLEGDICIVGAGAAGITLALKLAEAGRKVVLCEAGGLDLTDESQSCYVGEVRGDPYFDLEYARLRYLGGTTNHWNGWCRTFEPIDFDRSYIAPEHKWPITKADIDPYLAPARTILDLTTDFEDGEPNALGIKPIEWNYSPPTRFAEKYGDILAASEPVDLVLNANLVGADSAGGSVMAARFRSYSGAALTVRATGFVLALGGIENSRMLLWLRGQGLAGLIDDVLPIGNYWMEHPHFTLGAAFVAAEIRDQFGFGISAEVQRQEGILNCGLRVPEVTEDVARALLADLGKTAPTYAARVGKGLGEGRIVAAELRAAWEQEPVRANAVTLSPDARDRFGIPRVVLNWRKGALDRKTIRVATDLFVQWLMEAELGRARLESWVQTNDPYPTDDELAGFHHMGGTRMGRDPATSVVDGDCLVHGTANLYVAGSSVFTTAGHNNPTLPIVQLALRLGDHLTAV